MSVSAGNPVTIGLIGFGKFSRFIATSLATLPSVQLIAVHDTKIFPGARPLELPSSVRILPNLKELLADPTIEAVHIATPPGTHAEIALQALSAGKHVVVEKPLALTPKDARRVNEAARRAERVLAVNFVLRYNPLLQVFRRLIDSESLGPLRWLQLNNVVPRVEPSTHWFWDIAQSGGIHLEQGVHFFDAATYLLNNVPERITGELVFRGTKNTEAFATAVFPNNVLAHFSHGFLTDPFLGRTTWLLVWEKAQAVIYGWTPLRAEFSGAASPAIATTLQGLDFTVTPTTSALRAQYVVRGTEDEAYATAISGVWDDVTAAIHQHRPLAIDGAAGERSVSLAWRASRERLQLTDD